MLRVADRRRLPLATHAAGNRYSASQSYVSGERISHYLGDVVGVERQIPARNVHERCKCVADHEQNLGDRRRASVRNPCRVSFLASWHGSWIKRHIGRFVDGDSSASSTDKGKPVARRGRKATGLGSGSDSKIAGLPAGIAGFSGRVPLRFLGVLRRAENREFRGFTDEKRQMDTAHHNVDRFFLAACGLR